MIAKMPSDPKRVGGEMLGMAIWASVSEEVDLKIEQKIKGGIYPLRLKPEDWGSGKINWLIDIISPNQRLSTAVLSNFKQIVKSGQLKIHPIISTLVDSETLQKLHEKI